MSEITGDLRRKVDFKEPGGEIQALAMLADEIEAALKKTGTLIITAKNQHQFPEIGLLWDCIGSSVERVSDASTTLLLHFLKKNLMDTHFAHLHLLHLLSTAK